MTFTIGPVIHAACSARPLASSRASRVYRGLALLLVALARAAASGHAQTVRDSAGLMVFENRLPTSLPVCSLAATPTVLIGSADGDRPYLLDQVTDAAVLSDQRIAVLVAGSQEVRIYDRGGRFVRSIGRRGEGPGEFRNPWRLWVRHDTIIVGDYRPWRLQYFTTDGRLVRGIVPSPMLSNRPTAAELLADGSTMIGLACCSMPPALHKRTLQVNHHKASGEMRGTVGTYPFGELGVLQNAGPDGSLLAPLFESYTSVAVRGNDILVGIQDREEVMIVGVNGRPRALLRWRFPDDNARRVRQVDIEAFRAGRRAEMTPANRQFVMEDVSPQRPVRRTFPAFNALFGGTDGTIWVRRFRRPADERSDTFLVFTPALRFACAVTLPVGAGLVRAENGFVLLRQTDDDGVERVARYQVLGSLRRLP